MTYSAQQGEVEISRLHNVAICKEISERLAVGMKLTPSGMPPHLTMLMRRLRDKPLLTSARLFARVMGAGLALR
jgi:hypothetical protein